MIQRLIILLLIYYETCSCLQSFVNFDINGISHRKKFPWVVTISGQDKTKLLAYGSLIHERAVLTLNKMNSDEEYYFDFQVFAKCYNNSGPALTYHCAQVRNVTEYHIIEDIKTFYQDNLIIIILSKPFTLSQTINTVSFARGDEDYNHDNCIIMSLRHQINSRDHSQAATLVSPTYVKITNRHDEIYHDFYQLSIDASNGFKLTNDQNQVEEFTGKDLNGQTLDYTGSPLVCKSKRETDRWLLVGVADFKIIFGKNELLFHGHAIRIDFNDIQMTFNEIIKNYISPGIKHQELVLKYE